MSASAKQAEAMRTVAELAGGFPGGRAAWVVEGTDVEGARRRADVFVVVDDPALAARLKAVMAEGRIEHVEPTQQFELEARAAIKKAMGGA